MIPSRDVILSPLRASASLTGRWLPHIDFERDAIGNVLRSGAAIDDQFAAWGITVSGPSNAAIKPVVLDWSRSVSSSTPGAAAQGKVLTLAEYRDHDHDDHDDDHCYFDAFGNYYEDEERGWRLASGPITFDFQSPVQLDDLRLLGIKTGSSATIKLFGADGSLLQSQTLPGSISGAEQTVRLDGRQVARLVVDIQGQGALAQLIFNREIPAGSRIQVTGSTQTSEGSSYGLSLASPLVAASQWLVNWGDGRIDTFDGDPALAMHTFADGRSTPTLYATARDVQGNIYQANLWRLDVANVPPTLTITGSPTIQAGLPYTLQLSTSDPGNDRLRHWIIEWGDGSRSSLPGNATVARHTYKLAQSQSKSFTIRAAARDEDSSGNDLYRASDFVVSVTPDTSRVLPTIDFERDGNGSILRAPVRLSDQFDALGITVSSTASFPRGPMIVDSSKPATAARDIGTPNSTFKGPGYGLGGIRGFSGANAVAQRNVLILASDVRASSPEDYEAGGTLRFDFDEPVRLAEIHLLDIDKNGSFIKLYAADGSLISTQLVPRRGANSFQIVTLNASHVSRMDIELKGGGAIAAIVSQRGAPTIARPDSRFFVVDAADAVYRYSAPALTWASLRCPRAHNHVASPLMSIPIRYGSSVKKAPTIACWSSIPQPRKLLVHGSREQLISRKG